MGHDRYVATGVARRLAALTNPFVAKRSSGADAGAGPGFGEDDHRLPASPSAVMSSSRSSFDNDPQLDDLGA